ncbi:uncharacterized protein LOC117237243 [Bombus vosnesenskii]|uniref:Uncharacterized protein LOC117237243 n=1 Tax=Bombus vosnesenskii TaxID=207650 RepID=A0A6J3KV85_9HYME|nr:uncharacterized protein LOC117237243 [Bombus vosnesenskii]
MSNASTTVLAASPPFELLVLAPRRMFEDQRSRSSGGDSHPAEQATRDIQDEVRRETWERGRSHLVIEDQIWGHQAVRLVLRNWEAWRDRGGFPLSFRMTQVLSGHGVFGEYPKKIGREVTSTCHHCGEGEDTVQLTLWEAPRLTLRLTIGESSSVVKAMPRG